MEKCDVYLDEYARSRRNLNRKHLLSDDNTENSNEFNNVEKSIGLGRPQSRFLTKVDNSNKPFVPLIRSKPNALTPLPDYNNIDV